jgi:hypothetical protein
MKLRFIREIGTSAALRIYWGDKDCPNCLGGGRPGYHNGTIPLTKSEKVADWDLGGEVSDYPISGFPAACDHCAAAAPADVQRQVFTDRLYDTPSGKPEPGDCFWSTWNHDNGRCLFPGWTNCSGPHLVVVLPNGHWWDVDSRASNCTMPQDKVHRCWVRRGEPPNVHVDKNGPTCAAGAGSILADGYHGFLHNGYLTP